MGEWIGRTAVRIAYAYIRREYKAENPIMPTREGSMLHSFAWLRTNLTAR